MNKFELAYTAGYIDGDGCLYMGSYDTNKSTTYEYSVQVCSVNPDIIKWFQEKYGGAIRTKERRPNHKQPWVWTIKNEECINLVNQIQPYLIAKQQESHYFLEFALHIKDNNFSVLSSDAVEHRQELIKNKRVICHEANVIQKNVVTESWKNIISMPSKRNEEDFAYLAGLIDAEGCFRVKHYSRKNRPNKVYNICLEVGNTNKHFFEWLLFKFGGSVYFCKPASDNKKPSATWNLQAKTLFMFLPKIIQFLKYKKPVAEKLLEFSETVLPNGGDRHSDSFKKNYQEIISKREALIKEIQQFNSKGHKDSV